jgi:antitoxin component of MazEF toxin-antitoxin module
MKSDISVSLQIPDSVSTQLGATADASLLLAYGGSTIVLLVPKDRVQWDEDLLKNSRDKLETSVRVSTPSFASSQVPRETHILEYQ